MTALCDRPLALFDMDGTLLDTMPYWRGVLIELMEKLALGRCSDALRERLRTMSSRSGLSLVQEALSGVHALPITAQTVYDAIRAHYEERTPLPPGVHPLLCRLREAGVRLAVATATPVYLAEIALKKADIRDFFEAVFSTESVGLSKSEPDFFRRVLHTLREAPEHTVLFEDSLPPIRAAKSLGIYTVATEDPSQVNHREDLLQAADEYYADGFTNRIR